MQESIVKINAYIKTLLEKVYDDNKLKTPSIDVLVMTMLVTPFSFETFVTKAKPLLPVQVPEAEAGASQLLNIQLKDINKVLPMTHVSPIIAGIFNLRNSLFSVEGYTLYQFFGHVPVGVSTSVELHENKLIGVEQTSSKVERTSSKVEQTILINLDTSNSFLASALNVGGSYSRAHIQLGQADPVSVHSNIHINNSQPRTTFSDKITIPVIQNVIQLRIDNDLDKTFIDTCKIFEYINKKTFIETNRTLYYHGESTENYHIFTLNTDGYPFTKTVYILDETGFEAYIESAGYTPETQNKYYKYQNKYLKYKSKYTDLKKQLSNK